jgi:O-antigen/teichoic acid export membrane protein
LYGKEFVSLKEKTIKAISVLLFGHGLAQILRFAGNVIATRILAPELFGIMVIANGLAVLVSIFSDVGLSLSVVKSKNADDPEFLKTVYSLKVVQGGIVFFVICLFAGVIFTVQKFQVFSPEVAMAHPELPLAISIIALSSLIRGFGSIQIDVHKRKQLFGRQVGLELAAQISSTLFIVCYGLHSPTVFALAFASVFGAVVITLGSFVVYEFRYIGFAWDRDYIKEVLDFGKWILGSSSLAGISNYADRFILGSLLTGPQMGLYAIATLIYSAMEGVFKKMNQSLFATLSEIVRDQPENVSNAYYRIRRLRDLIVCAPACFMIVNGDLIVQMIYDDRYAEAGVLLQLLSIGHLIGIYFFKGQVIMAEGNSKLQFTMATWRLVGLLILVPIGYHVAGMHGLVLAVALRGLFVIWIPFKYFIQRNLIQLGRELRALVHISVLLGISGLFRLVINYFV